VTALQACAASTWTASWWSIKRHVAAAASINRVATFSLSQSGTGVWGRAPSRRASRGITPGKLLEFYMWFGAFWCNLLAVICRPPDPVHLYFAIKLNWSANYSVLMIALQCYCCLVASMPWNPGHLASWGWSCWDAEPHDTNPGHPGKSGTGGNPKHQWVSGSQSCLSVHVCCQLVFEYSSQDWVAVAHLTNKCMHCWYSLVCLDSKCQMLQIWRDAVKQSLMAAVKLASVLSSWTDLTGDLVVWHPASLQSVLYVSNGWCSTAPRAWCGFQKLRDLGLVWQVDALPTLAMPHTSSWWNVGRRIWNVI